MNIQFLVFIKPIINRMRYMKTRDWAYVFIFLALIISPSFLLKLNKGDTNTTLNFNIDTLATLILFFGSILVFTVAKPNYKRVANLILPEYMLLLKLVPSRYKVLLCYSQLKKLLSTIVVASILLLVYLLMSGEKMESVGKLIVLVSAILIFIRASFIVFPTLISFAVTTRRQVNILKITSIIMMIVSVVLYFVGYKYRMIYLPNYILASGFHSLLTRNTDNFLFLVLVLMIFTCIILSILRATKIKYIKPANVYEASIYQTKLQNKVSHNFIGFTQMFPFLSQRLKLIASKETLQFLNEYHNLVTILFNTVLLVIIAIIGKNSVPFPIEKSILFSSVAYLSFYVGLTSIARDINNVWMFKLAYPRWMQIAVAKYASSLINVCFTLLFFLPVLLIAVILTKNSFINFFVKGLHWSIIIVPFAAISLGMLLSTILPVKLKDNNEKITYSYQGIEGVFYLIVILLVAAPIIFIENSSMVYKIIIVSIYFSLSIYSIYRISKKLMSSI